MRKKNIGKMLAVIGITAVMALQVISCGKTSDKNATSAAKNDTTESGTLMSNEEIIKKAAEDGKVGNWGMGNEYQVQALLAKYGEPTDYLVQDFNMDGFDDGSIELASAMTYNELGLIKNDYDGGYGYGDSVGIIDFNEEGVAMLEDNLFCTKEFAKKNPNTVKAFIYATKKGWEYACENPDEAADIVFKYGSSVSEEHQKYMAETMADLCTHDFSGKEIENLCSINRDDMKQTLDLAQQYIVLDDSSANDILKNMKCEDLYDDSFYQEALASSDGKFGTLEKKKVKMQLCWLPQAEFMGYYVALDKGYYKEEGLDMEIVAGGGDIAETTAVYNGSADFGTTMVSNMIAANAGGMDLVEIAQPFEKSGMVLVYKKADFMK